MTIPTNCYEKELEETEDGGVRLTVEYDDGSEETFEADQLFLFTGRRPTVEGLGLENTPVSVDGDWAETRCRRAPTTTSTSSATRTGKSRFCTSPKSRDTSPQKTSSRT